MIARQPIDMKLLSPPSEASRGTGGDVSSGALLINRACCNVLGNGIVAHSDIVVDRVKACNFQGFGDGGG